MSSPITVHCEGLGQIPLSVEETWELVADPRHAPHMYSGIADAYTLEGEAGVPGHVWAQREASSGSGSLVELTVVEAEKPRLLVVTGEHRGTRLRRTARLTETSMGTTRLSLRLDATMVDPPWLTSLLRPIVAHSFRSSAVSGFEAELQEMREYAERGGHRDHPFW